MYAKGTPRGRQTLTGLISADDPVDPTATTSDSLYFRFHNLTPCK